MNPSASDSAVQSIIEHCIRPDVQALQAYAVQDARGLIKLDAMENPYPLPLALRHELAQRLHDVELNRYPGDSTRELKQALTQHLALPDTHALVLGNGSDELISLLALACARPGAAVLAPVPGFVMYEMSAQLQGLSFVGVPLTSHFELDLPAMLAAVEQHRPVLTFLAYPNNPTANLWDPRAMQAVIQAVAHQGGLVVVDEAYEPFAEHSYLVPALADPHVLVMRTMSKLGLAGVRIGYLAGAAALVREIDKVRPPYNVSVLNAQAALFALQHMQELTRQALLIRQERDRLAQALSALPGVSVFPSQANMILFRVARATAVFDAIRARGVLIKNVSKLHPLLRDCLRVTVGTPQENSAFLEALAASLN